MCKASVYADEVVDAEANTTYGIGITSHRLGALHPLGVTAEECVACLRDGAVVYLKNIPPKLQHRYGIGEKEQAIFIEQPGSEYEAIDDLLAIGDENPTYIELSEFGHVGGVVAYVERLGAGLPKDVLLLEDNRHTVFELDRDDGVTILEPTGVIAAGDVMDFDQLRTTRDSPAAVERAAA